MPAAKSVSADGGKRAVRFADRDHVAASGVVGAGVKTRKSAVGVTGKRAEPVPEAAGRGSDSSLAVASKPEKPSSAMSEGPAQRESAKPVKAVERLPAEEGHVRDGDQTPAAAAKTTKADSGGHRDKTTKPLEQAGADKRSDAGNAETEKPKAVHTSSGPEVSASGEKVSISDKNKPAVHRNRDPDGDAIMAEETDADGGEVEGRVGALEPAKDSMLPTGSTSKAQSDRGDAPPQSKVTPSSAEDKKGSGADRDMPSEQSRSEMRGVAGTRIAADKSDVPALSKARPTERPPPLAEARPRNSVEQRMRPPTRAQPAVLFEEDEDDVDEVRPVRRSKSKQLQAPEERPSSPTASRAQKSQSSRDFEMRDRGGRGDRDDDSDDRQKDPDAEMEHEPDDEVLGLAADADPEPGEQPIRSRGPRRGGDIEPPVTRRRTRSQTFSPRRTRRRNSEPVRRQPAPPPHPPKRRRKYPVKGDRIRLLWHVDKIYYEGFIESVLNFRGKKFYDVTYNDAEKEYYVDFTHRKWHFVDGRDNGLSEDDSDEDSRSDRPMDPSKYPKKDDRLMVMWHVDGKYYPSVVTHVMRVNQKIFHDVAYDEGTEEFFLDFSFRKWRFEVTPTVPGPADDEDVDEIEPVEPPKKKAKSKPKPARKSTRTETPSSPVAVDKDLVATGSRPLPPRPAQVESLYIPRASQVAQKRAARQSLPAKLPASPQSPSGLGSPPTASRPPQSPPFLRSPASPSKVGSSPLPESPLAALLQLDNDDPVTGPHDTEGVRLPPLSAAGLDFLEDAPKESADSGEFQRPRGAEINAISEGLVEQKKKEAARHTTGIGLEGDSISAVRRKELQVMAASSSAARPSLAKSVEGVEAGETRGRAGHVSAQQVHALDNSPRATQGKGPIISPIAQESWGAPAKPHGRKEFLSEATPAVVETGAVSGKLDGEQPRQRKAFTEVMETDDPVQAGQSVLKGSSKDRPAAKLASTERSNERTRSRVDDERREIVMIDPSDERRRPKTRVSDIISVAGLVARKWATEEAASIVQNIDVLDKQVVGLKKLQATTEKLRRKRFRQLEQSYAEIENEEDDQGEAMADEEQMNNHLGELKTQVVSLLRRYRKTVENRERGLKKQFAELRHENEAQSARLIECGNAVQSLDHTALPELTAIEPRLRKDLPAHTSSALMQGAKENVPEHSDPGNEPGVISPAKPTQSSDSDGAVRSLRKKVADLSTRSEFLAAEVKRLQSREKSLLKEKEQAMEQVTKMKFGKTISLTADRRPGSAGRLESSGEVQPVPVLGGPTPPGKITKVAPSKPVGIVKKKGRGAPPKLAAKNSGRANRKSLPRGNSKYKPPPPPPPPKQVTRPQPVRRYLTPVKEVLDVEAEIPSVGDQAKASKNFPAQLGKQMDKQAADLLALIVTVWLLQDEGRSEPPKKPSEKQDKWVDTCVKNALRHAVDYLTRCTGGIMSARRALMDDMDGERVETSWISAEHDNGIEAARLNYKLWDPPLRDIEWQAEKRVLSGLNLCIRSAMTHTTAGRFAATIMYATEIARKALSDCESRGRAVSNLHPGNTASAQKAVLGSGPGQGSGTPQYSNLQGVANPQNDVSKVTPVASFAPSRTQTLTIRHHGQSFTNTLSPKMTPSPSPKEAPAGAANSKQASSTGAPVSVSKRALVDIGSPQELPPVTRRRESASLPGVESGSAARASLVQASPSLSSSVPVKDMSASTSKVAPLANQLSQASKAKASAPVENAETPRTRETGSAAKPSGLFASPEVLSVTHETLEESVNKALSIGNVQPAGTKAPETVAGDLTGAGKTAPSTGSGGENAPKKTDQSPAAESPKKSDNVAKSPASAAVAPVTTETGARKTTDSPPRNAPQRRAAAAKADVTGQEVAESEVLPSKTPAAFNNAIKLDAQSEKFGAKVTETGDGAGAETASRRTGPLHQNQSMNIPTAPTPGETKKGGQISQDEPSSTVPAPVKNPKESTTPADHRGPPQQPTESSAFRKVDTGRQSDSAAKDVFSAKNTSGVSHLDDTMRPTTGQSVPTSKPGNAGVQPTRAPVASPSVAAPRTTAPKSGTSVKKSAVSVNGEKTKQKATPKAQGTKGKSQTRRSVGSKAAGRQTGSNGQNLSSQPFPKTSSATSIPPLPQSSTLSVPTSGALPAPPRVNRTYLNTRKPSTGAENLPQDDPKPSVAKMGLPQVLPFRRAVSASDPVAHVQNNSDRPATGDGTSIQADRQDRMDISPPKNPEVPTKLSAPQPFAPEAGLTSSVHGDTRSGIAQSERHPLLRSTGSPPAGGRRTSQNTLYQAAAKKRQVGFKSIPAPPRRTNPSPFESRRAIESRVPATLSYAPFDPSSSARASTTPDYGRHTSSHDLNTSPGTTSNDPYRERGRENDAAQGGVFGEGDGAYGGYHNPASERQSDLGQVDLMNPPTPSSFPGLEGYINLNDGSVGLKRIGTEERPSLPATPSDFATDRPFGGGLSSPVNFDRSIHPTADPFSSANRNPYTNSSAMPLQSGGGSSALNHLMNPQQQQQQQRRDDVYGGTGPHFQPNRPFHPRTHYQRGPR